MIKDINASLANLEAQSNVLSALADNTGQVLENTENKLSQLSFKLEFWLSRPPLMRGAFIESSRSGEIGRCEVQQLGFSKAGAKWKLCIRSITEVTHHESDHPDEVSTYSLQTNPHTKPLDKASRLLRVKAYNLLPKFLEAYGEMINKLVREAKSQTAPDMFSDPEAYKNHMDSPVVSKNVQPDKGAINLNPEES